jgi:hypothetical protein
MRLPEQPAHRENFLSTHRSLSSVMSRPSENPPSRPPEHCLITH